MEFWSWNQAHSADRAVELLHNLAAVTKLGDVLPKTQQSAEVTMVRQASYDIYLEIPILAPPVRQRLCSGTRGPAQTPQQLLNGWSFMLPEDGSPYFHHEVKVLHKPVKKKTKKTHKHKD